MIFLKLFLLVFAALIVVYFLFYLRQLRTIKREVKELVLAKLFFVSILMIILAGIFGVILLLSISFDLVVERVS